VLAGSAPPGEALHHAVAAGGAMVLAEWHLGAAHRHGPEIAGTPDPFAGVAAAQHRDVPSMRRFGQALDHAVRIAQDCGATGLLLWLTEEDEAYAWQVPALIKRAADAGLRLLPLVRQPWQLDDATGSRIAAFARGETGP
jgi:hypothetical protein